MYYIMFILFKLVHQLCTKHLKTTTQLLCKNSYHVLKFRLPQYQVITCLLGKFECLLKSLTVHRQHDVGLT